MSVMMDDSAPTRERKKLIKIYNIKLFPLNKPVIAEVCGETY